MYDSWTIAAKPRLAVWQLCLLIQIFTLNQKWWNSLKSATKAFTDLYICIWNLYACLWYCLSVLTLYVNTHFHVMLLNIDPTDLFQFEIRYWQNDVKPWLFKFQTKSKIKTVTIYYLKLNNWYSQNRVFTVLTLPTNW